MGNPVVYFEIGCRDRVATSQFYEHLFDWTVRPEEHSHVVSSGSNRGIDGHIASLGHEPHNYTIFYVDVDDVPAALAKAETLGGKTLVPPVTIPNGTFAWFADPEGNTIGLWKAAK